MYVQNITFHNQASKQIRITDLVSVIVPSYNGAYYLKDAMNSVFNQTYRPIELIVVDDGSTDQTRKVVEQWFSTCAQDPQFTFRYLYQKKQGASTARNNGLMISQGSYIQFLDADDVLAAEKIATQMLLLKNAAENIAAYGPSRYFENDKKHLMVYDLIPTYYQTGEDRPLLSWIKGAFIPSHAILWQRQDLKRLGFWDESLAADQDGELAMRFLLFGGQFVFCAKAWVYYRSSPNYRASNTHVSRRATGTAIRSRIRVAHRIENLLTERNLLDSELRAALAGRYYEIARNWASKNRILRRICLANYRRLAQKNRAIGCAHASALDLVILSLKQKARYFLRCVLGIPAFWPALKLNSIEELLRLDS